jgi:5,10-methylenetetrahydrofolate reductase
MPTDDRAATTTTTSSPPRRATLASALSSRSFVVTAELGPPRDPDPELVRAGARALAGSVDAVNVTDNQAATVKLSPVATAALLIDEGVDPILQITGRDRNVMALQSELLGAWALGVRTVLTLTGDPLTVGPYEGIATPVGDLDSLGLTRLIATLNEGRLAAGEPLEQPPSFLIAGAANPLVDSVERLEGKLEAGVGLLQTNIVYDVDRFAEWLAPFVEAGITQRAPLLVGIAPPRSDRMLTYMDERIPGVEVDDATFARMEGLTGEAAASAGIEIAAELVRRVREVPGVSGVHLMAPGWESVAVPAVARAAGLEAPVVG